MGSLKYNRPIGSIYHLYIANWVTILPTTFFSGTKKLHWSTPGFHHHWHGITVIVQTPVNSTRAVIKQIWLFGVWWCGALFNSRLFYGDNNKLGGGFKAFLFSSWSLGRWSNLTFIFFERGWFNNQLGFASFPGSRFFSQDHQDFLLQTVTPGSLECLTWCTKC